jgi:hypothetical protein
MVENTQGFGDFGSIGLPKNTWNGTQINPVISFVFRL